MPDKAFGAEARPASHLRLDRTFGGTHRARHGMLRKLTTSSASRLRLRRLSCTALGQLCRRHGGKPGSVVAAPRGNLGDDDEIVRIGMKRLCDRLVGDVWPVEIAGVDVVHAAGHCLAQHGERFSRFFGGRIRGPGELHGAISPFAARVRSPSLKVPDLSMRVMSGLLFRLFRGLTADQNCSPTVASLFAHSAFGKFRIDRVGAHWMRRDAPPSRAPRCVPPISTASSS